MGIVCISALFWIVLDHFFITFALDPEKMISPLANCLGGQNLRLNGEGYLISSKL